MAWKLGHYSTMVITLIPILSILFTYWVIVTFNSIKEAPMIPFVVISLEYMGNWILLVVTNKPWQGHLTSPSGQEEASWFCRRCKRDFPYDVQHCPVCARCWRDRDHHCFFLGTCVNRRNMKYFLTFMMYTVLGSGLVLRSLLPHLSEQFQAETKLTSLTLAGRFFYPIMFVRWLCGHETWHMFAMSAMFGILVSITVTVFFYVVYQWYRILSGNIFQNNVCRTQRSVSSNFRAVFGERGLLHLVIPLPSVGQGDTVEPKMKV